MLRTYFPFLSFYKLSMKVIKAPVFLKTTIFILWSGSLLIKMSTQILISNLIWTTAINVAHNAEKQSHKSL